MSKGISVHVDGVSELLDILEKAGPRHSRNLMRATIHGVAGEITKQAKRNAPKDKGTLKKAIKTKRKKSPPDKPVSDVIVEHGNDARHDAFYWRFPEYGTKDLSEQPFIRPAADNVRADFDNILTRQFGKKLEAALKREAKRNAKK